jgi:hypothetical protein
MSRPRVVYGARGMSESASGIERDVRPSTGYVHDADPPRNRNIDHDAGNTLARRVCSLDPVPQADGGVEDKVKGSNQRGSWTAHYALA